MKLLLDAGADKVVEDIDGNTPFQFITELEIARLLTDEPMIISRKVNR